MARKRQNKNLPTFDELIIPTLKALKKLGGSGTIEEISENVYQIANISEDALQILHNENGLLNEVDYRLAWSRTYLKKYGLIENSARGVWALTKSELDISKLDANEIVKNVRDQHKSAEPKKIKPETETEADILEQVEETTNWKEELLNTLFSISPDAFERLAQRLLRESGFVQVEVTGKSGDGGIDGKGIVKLSGFLSFHVIFQCKRYRGTITPSQIRDFRGAMQGRADKGLFITTGTFTRDATKEATRDGAPPIDLIDGELLCEKLKEFRLGVETKFIENVDVQHDWFLHL
ncbi:restriction endonuclease [Adhaeribacter arboris]|uniref:Restriction endonuclease n=1 Tax=Adhaeribacter arboris TaxID=2072846 RepID=A0A2T2YE79_9BACT|nr:restriction endonuclease [Adhaeribacter arboris]PSR53812.1 restriction endonuclease [Adhaeribacter arboris]